MRGIGIVNQPVRDADLNKFSVEHRVRRLQNLQAPPKGPPPKRRIVKELVLIGIATVALLLLWPSAQVATADYPEARALADRLEAALQPVWRGATSLEDVAVSNDLRLYQFTVDGQTTSVLTHPQPTAFGTCYGMRTGGGLVTAAVRFAPTDGCVPQGRTAFLETGAWSEVLPRREVTPPWFIPAVGILGGIALAAASSLTMKLIVKS